ncbi:DUF2934 domain-containing protein [Neorhizobium alkalisoli]|uniref:DUF2934 domain-containing protein n=1 Tax=Neorhizobium alkalisoli TaxID=528178 RepID=UPI00119CB6C4|nr:DUF2934 domain-containing protein [Neorhizobium alkalisoli]
MSDEDRIREDAYARWEAEGRPDGQHERHWREASQVYSSSGAPQTSYDAGRSQEKDEGIRPEDLDSENDQGAA